MTQKFVLALPKGRILDQILPILEGAGLELEPAFFDGKDRRLRFATSDPQLDVIRVRSFDVATFLAYGAAHMAVAGSDVLMEFDHPEIYAPVDLRVGTCRLAVASPQDVADEDDPKSWSHLRVATKYPNITAQHFANRGVAVIHEFLQDFQQFRNIFKMQTGCGFIQNIDGFTGRAFG